jgi:hypothetical protein
MQIGVRSDRVRRAGATMGPRRRRATLPWSRRRSGRAATLLAAAACVGASLAPGSAPAAAQDPGDWCPEPEARAFDFWIGEWDVVNHNRPAGGDRWHATGTATNRVYPVVGGCAIVEHWRGYAFPSAGHIVGFSVRAWDRAAEQWELVLLWPVASPPRFGNPEGRFHEGRGEFFGSFVTPAGDTVRSRLAFYDITESSFTWSNGVSRDGGESWVSTWRMESTRRSPRASGLWNGPSMTTDHCPGAVHRTFDPWLGEWIGTRTDASGDTLEVRTHLVRILDGCAVMERTVAGDGSWERFAVRAYEPGIGRWVEYAVGSDRRTLHRREADGAGTGPVFTDVEPAGGSYQRTRWRLEDDGIRRVVEESSSADGPWSRIRETVFRARVGQRSGV